MNCGDARLLIQDADDRRDEALSREVVAHLAECASCRELRFDLDSLSELLRARPRASLPPDALDAVWRRTIRGGKPMRFRLAAAAALAAAVLGGSLYFGLVPNPGHEPSSAEIARASAQADLVLAYAARALVATRDATADRVIGSKVSPAVRAQSVSHGPRRSR